MLVWIQFGKGMAGCGNMNLFNRESPRINANRIFLAFGCSAPADACKSKICVPPQTGFACLGFAYAESHPLLKNAIGKTRVRVFLLFHYFFDYTKREVNGEKNRHAGFSYSIFPDVVRFLRRRSAGAEHNGARKMRFALIRGDSRLVFSHTSRTGITRPELDPHQHRVTPIQKKRFFTSDP
ncbi:hypothetical protein SDC9_18353 [bioreactor metagenome]|uniref:Uncharacterized protein n=1 Tax=bioreactor metagenome TaxID=1076179 RepID=A0A644U015_9ZZZZ